MRWYKSFKITKVLILSQNWLALLIQLWNQGMLNRPRRERAFSQPVVAGPL